MTVPFEVKDYLIKQAILGLELSAEAAQATPAIDPRLLTLAAVNSAQ